MPKTQITCNLPGRKMPESRFCPNEEMNEGKQIVSYDKCASCPFRNTSNTIQVSFPEPLELNKELPPLPEQASNFISSMAKAVMDGFKVVTEEEYNKRLEICKGCPFYKYSRCTKCGCFMNFKSKLNSGSCPEGKW